MLKPTRHTGTFKKLIPGISVGLVILVLTGLPGKCFPTIKTFWEWLGPDKIVHSLMFAGLAFASAWGFRKDYIVGDRHFRKKVEIVTLLLCCTYGGLTELLQKYVFIGRYGSFFDFYADAIGCFLGVLVFHAIFQKK